MYAPRYGEKRESMSTQTVPMDDKELFSSAVSDEAIPKAEAAPVPEETPAQEAEALTETAERARDANGRFVAKTETPQAEQVQEQPPVEQQPQAAAQKEDAHVPSWRLREVNEAREAAERRLSESQAQLSQLQQQLNAPQRQSQQNQEPIDWYQDPNAALTQRFAPFEDRLQELSQATTIQNSELRALIFHGKDAVDEAKKSLSEGLRLRDPDVLALDAAATQSRDPWSLVMQWHQKSKLLKETGGNLDSYRQKILDDAMKDPQFVAKVMETARAQATGQTGAKQPVVQLPPSLNRAASAASPHEDLGDLSDRSLYAAATR